jgi:hypothetical protein
MSQRLRQLSSSTHLIFIHFSYSLPVYRVAMVPTAQQQHPPKFFMPFKALDTLPVYRVATVATAQQQHSLDFLCLYCVAMVVTAQ